MLSFHVTSPLSECAGEPTGPRSSAASPIELTRATTEGVWEPYTG